MQNKIILSGIYEFLFKSSGKKYIGSSINLNKRNANHISALKHNNHYNQHLQRAFNKYGIKDLEYKILELVENEDFINKIIKSKDFQKILFKIEQKYLDQYFAQEYIKNSKDKRFFDLLYNKSVLSEAPNRVSTQFNKMKEVYKFSKNGDYIESYYNSQIAELCTKINSCSIRRCCDNIRKSAGNFYWSYSRNAAFINHYNKKKIYQYDKHRNLIKKWESLKEAREATGIDIRKEKKNNIITQGDFYWLYEGEKFPLTKRRLHVTKNKILEIKTEIEKYKTNSNKNYKLSKFIIYLSDKYEINTQTAYDLVNNKTYKNFT